MTIEELLQMIEEFLDKDLKSEKLSVKTHTKRKQLAAKVRDAIEEQNKDKLEKFLEEQRQKTRYSLPDVNRPNLPLPRVPNTNSNDVIEKEPDEELYMDLNDPNITSDDPTSMISSLSVTSPVDGGSGSGYESYASDEDNAARNKYVKEIETVNKYFAGTNCDVYSFVFLENKSFLSGKKWLKRIGIVRENHFQCFKKLGDTNAVLDLPLSLYSAYLSSKDGTNSVIINLESSGSQGEGYRFYVEHSKADEWNRVLREKAASVVQTGSLPAPRVVSRPANTLPPSERPINRQSSLGVVDPPQLAINDKPIRMNGDAPGSPPTSLNHIGKNLKSAVTDMFKKDKTKKKISVAEQLGADLCGGLTVYIDHKWSKKFCVIKNNDLLVYGKDEAPEITLPLHGCDLHPYFEDPEKQCTFKLTEGGRDVLFLSANNSEEMGKWIGKLIAETGCAEIPETPEIKESVYVEPELYLSVMNRAREVFNQTIRLKKQATKLKKNVQEEAPDESAESLYMDLDISNAPASLLASNRVKAEAKTPKPETTRQISNDPPSPTKPKPKKRPPSPPGRKRGESDVTPSPTQPPQRFNFNKKLESEASETKTVKTHKKHNSKDLKQNGMESPVGKKNEKNLPIVARKMTIESDGQESKETDPEKRLAEINYKLDRLAVRQTELTKYAEASKTPKSEVEKLLKHVKSDSDRLKTEKIDIELEVRKMKNTTDTSLNSAGNRRQQQRPRGNSNVTSPTGGNVMSRAKMFENLEAQK